MAMTRPPAANPPPAASGLPAGAGTGFKTEHAEAYLARRAPVAFVEVHAENYMGDGGPPLATLGRLREMYPLSLHGVGLSIGGETPPDERHLARLASLVARFGPASFSEHLAWSSHDTHYLNDLLPIAYNAATLARVCDHVDLVQERLGLRMLLENPSTYVAFADSDLDEIDFIAEVSRRTGCGLLLDVNNVQVTCVNHGRDPFAYIDAFPVSAVGEFHLAGHATETDSLGAPLLIDAHDRPVDDTVWAIYRHALARTGPLPTLIEWDNDIPPADTLFAEAARAEALLRDEAVRRNRAA